MSITFIVYFYHIGIHFSKKLSLFCYLIFKYLLSAYSIIYKKINFMVKENSKTAEPPIANPMGMFGDMSLLREIIMGPKVIEYETKFNDLETLIQKTDDATKALIKQNNDATKTRLDTLEQDINARFDRLEQLLTQNVDNLHQQLNHSSQADKALLADLLVHVSKKLTTV